MDPLLALRAVLVGVHASEATTATGGHRCLVVTGLASKLTTKVLMVDGHYAIEPIPGDALIAIAPIGDLELAARRVHHQVAPAVTS